MVCCVEAYGFYKINSQKIKRINKTEASVREPPAQEVASKGTLQKTGQPTNERLIERCGRARSSFPTLDFSLIYPLLHQPSENCKSSPDRVRRTRTISILTCPARLPGQALSRWQNSSKVHPRLHGELTQTWD